MYCIHHEVGMAIANLGIMKWLHENGVPWTNDTFAQAAYHGDIDTMKWLYEKGCPWGMWTFNNAVEHGDLKNMKWLHKKGCLWGENTFTWAACHGDIDNMKWLYKKECPWGYANIEDLRGGIGIQFVKANIVQWMQENGCPKFDYDY